MSLLINFLLAIYVIVALLMVLVILMQRPKSEGLGAAFGGGVTENIFGAQTTNVLTKFTTWLASLFFLLTFVLSILYAHRSVGTSGLRQELMKNQTTKSAPVASPSAAQAASPSQGTAAPVSSSPQPENTTSGVLPPGGSAAPSATGPEASPKPNP